MIARHLLGWDAPPLERAADWIAEHLGADQGNAVVALPVRRAGRLLRERLAARLGPSWTPPRFVTAGTLTDALLVLERAPAGRLARTLAWVLALRGLSARDLASVVAAPPAEDDLVAWTRLASEVRSLFGELAADGLGFGDVAEGPARRAAGGGERARWAALARAQTRMHRLLESEGLTDPHLARADALDEGRILSDTRVVLVGVVEVNRLTRRLLGNCDGDSLVFAPPGLSEHFDDLGCVRPGAWKDHHTALDLAHWHVVEQPVQQAEQAVRCLTEFGPDRYAAEDITIGVARASVTPYLRRALGEERVTARDAAGTPVTETSPVRLLAGLAAHLARPSFRSWSALLRHDDVERLLRRNDSLAKLVPARAADAYHQAHVPDALDGTWLADERDERDVHRRDRIAALHAAFDDWLRPVSGAGRRPVREWSPVLRGILEAVYGRRALEPDETERDRLLAEGLAAIGRALAQLEGDVPAGLAPLATVAEAANLLLDVLRGQAVPPRQARPDEPTIDLLGWLELPLDPAPALVVTGFDEGCVPEARHGDAWLPDSARRELGMSDNAQRLARDLYLVDLLVHSRRDVAFVSGRRTLEGDPVLPSRIAFHRPSTEVPARVAHALLEGGTPAVDVDASVGAASPPFDPALGHPPERWSASAFKAFLRSPYLFWVERIARLDTIDDRQQELDALRFGNLAHAVLEDFGGGEVRDSADPKEIAAYLRERLHQRAAERFGAGTYPAVRLQLHQLEYRLGLFAQHQAQRTAEGWRIAHVEWKPKNRVELDVPGGAVELTGIIDRIDRHADGRWAILDYKTSESSDAPEKTHRKKGEWVDVQLPLYARLARELVGDDPQLGYVTLGREAGSVRFAWAPWSPAERDEALDIARAVVREVRRLCASGAPFPHRACKVWDPIHKALVGERLVGSEVEA